MTAIIKNSESLGETRKRRDILEMVEAGYSAIDTRTALIKAVNLSGDTLTVVGNTYNLKKDQKIWVIGAGKCSVGAGSALEEILGDRIAGGTIIDVADTNHRLPLKKIKSFLGSHPKPSEKNVKATAQLVDTLHSLKEDDIVIVLVSGGGSTLLCLPEEPVTVATEVAVFEELTDAGATIQEMNTVRKHLSKARGGKLAEVAYPARVVSLIFSDVPGNDISFISSGPTVKDETTTDDARAIIEKYNVRALSGVALLPTPKDEKFFVKVNNELLVTNVLALQAMAETAKEKGYKPRIVTDRFSGEARDVAQDVLNELSKAEPGTVLLYGGESTVTLNENAGKGGRSQELALSALAHIHDDEVIIPFSSDGHDDTDFAGALCDNITRVHAEEHALDIGEYLASHSSYDFFTATADALITGYTGSNVSDLIIALKARIT